MTFFINKGQWTKTQLDEIRLIAVAAFYTAYDDIKEGDTRAAGHRFNEWWDTSLQKPENAKP